MNEYVSTIRRAAVIGAGVMGSAIAAHIANAGVPVMLLDIVPEGATKDKRARNTLAQGAIEKLQKTEPAPLMTPEAARLITPGNIEDDLKALGSVDWIIEAVIERLDVKRALYARLAQAKGADTIVSSNTSTLTLDALLEGAGANFAASFLITHFFNPPRYMRLLEIVAGPKTRADNVTKIADFCDHALGKSVVRAHDTPGFIANRLGVYWMQAAIGEALDAGLSVEEADAVMGAPIGAPKTGIFALLDLVGLDLQPHIEASLAKALPQSDPYHALRRDFPLLQQMIAKGYTGRKGKGGFYRLNTEGGARIKEAIDLKTGLYREAARPYRDFLPAAKAGLQALVSHPGKAGRYAWAVLKRFLSYAALTGPDIADDISGIDRALECGFNFKHGPFAMIDALGAAWFAARLAAENLPVPRLLEMAAKGGGFYKVVDGRLHDLGFDGTYRPVTRPEGVLLLQDVKRAGAPLAENASASLWDIGDGVACLEFHSKMNALDRDSIAMTGQALEIVKARMKALVIYNEGENFSAGANIGLALFAANIALWPEIEAMIAGGQATFRALKFAPFPVVGAPSGLALGGGCEILLHCAAIEAHAETYMGLVETGIGLVPGWGGPTELLLRLAADPHLPKGPMPAIMAAFETISMAKVSRSASEARALGFLRKGDGITMNRDRLLMSAKRRALALVNARYKPPVPQMLALPGPSGAAALARAIDGFLLQGKALPHDGTVARALAIVLTGGAEADPLLPIPEETQANLARAAFMNLIRQRPTRARMEQMLETGKPLRN